MRKRSRAGRYRGAHPVPLYRVGQFCQPGNAADFRAARLSVRGGIYEGRESSETLQNEEAGRGSQPLPNVLKPGSTG